MSARWSSSGRGTRPRIETSCRGGRDVVGAGVVAQEGQAVGAGPQVGAGLEGGVGPAGAGLEPVVSSAQRAVRGCRCRSARRCPATGTAWSPYSCTAASWTQSTGCRSAQSLASTSSWTSAVSAARRWSRAAASTAEPVSVSRSRSRSAPRVSGPAADRRPQPGADLPRSQPKRRPPTARRPRLGSRWSRYARWRSLLDHRGAALATRPPTGLRTLLDHRRGCARYSTTDGAAHATRPPKGQRSLLDHREQRSLLDHRERRLRLDQCRRTTSDGVDDRLATLVVLGLADQAALEELAQFGQPRGRRRL